MTTNAGTPPAGATSLVTGASGFIGAALVRTLLASGVPVRAISRSADRAPTRDVIAVDLASGIVPGAAFDRVDTIYHLAAKTHDLTAAEVSDADYWTINLEGTQRLLDAARQYPIRRIVFVSSVKAQTEETASAVDETHPPQPTTAYGRSKLAAERLVLTEANRRGFEGVCLRFPIVYGAGQRGNLARMITAIDRGRFPPPPPGVNRRSMLHVDNAVAALLLAGRHPAAAGHTYLVTDAAPYSTREIYDSIRSALGRRPVRWSIPPWMFRALARTGDSARAVLKRRVGFDSEALQKLLGSAWFSSDRISRELGYQPSRTLQNALPQLIAEHRARSGRR